MCTERGRLICISKWCVCLLAKVFLHVYFCDLLTVSRSFCCLWHNGVIKHNVSISHISTTTCLFIDSQSVRAMLSWYLNGFMVFECVTQENWGIEGKFHSTTSKGLSVLYIEVLWPRETANWHVKTMNSLFSPDTTPHTQSQGFVLNTDHTPLLYFFQFKNLLISLCAK